MKHLPFWIFFLLLTGVACTSKTKLSPEETVQTWQSYIDKNEFDRARELSIAEALNYVNELASYNTDTDTLAWENNVLLNLKCQTMGDSAICTYNFEDELGEPIPGQLALLRVKGHWFVCRTNFDNLLPADTLRPGDENLVFPTDSLDEELE